jgi:hypothetical protein
VATPAATSTVLRNTTAVYKTLTLPIPPYTVRLGPGADFEYKGDLFAVLAVKNPRYLASLQEAIAAGTWVVVQTPVIHRYDAGTTRVREINISGDALSLTDPDAGSYGGPAPIQSYTGPLSPS